MQHFAQNTRNVPGAACKFTSKKQFFSRLNLHAEIRQICPLLTCKIACFRKQNYMYFAGKNTTIAHKNTR